MIDREHLTNVGRDARNEIEAATGINAATYIGDAEHNAFFNGARSALKNLLVRAFNMEPGHMLSREDLIVMLTQQLDIVDVAHDVMSENRVKEDRDAHEG